MLMAPFIGSCNFNITIIVFQSNAVQQSMKANQGWPKDGKGCPCLNAGNCLRVMFSFLSAAISSASRLCYLMHSCPIPPVVVNTSGVNKPCSTSNTFLEYDCFLSFSWIRWICCGSWSLKDWSLLRMNCCVSQPAVFDSLSIPGHLHLSFFPTTGHLTAWQLKCPFPQEFAIHKTEKKDNSGESAGMGGGVHGMARIDWWIIWQFAKVLLVKATLNQAPFNAFPCYGNS